MQVLQCWTPWNTLHSCQTAWCQQRNTQAEAQEHRQMLQWIQVQQNDFLVLYRLWSMTDIPFFNSEAKSCILLMAANSWWSRKCLPGLRTVLNDISGCGTVTRQGWSGWMTFSIRQSKVCVKERERERRGGGKERGWRGTVDWSGLHYGLLSSC